jgi:hypothetical protein
MEYGLIAGLLGWCRRSRSCFECVSLPGGPRLQPHMDSSACFHNFISFRKKILCSCMDIHGQYTNTTFHSIRLQTIKLTIVHIIKRGRVVTKGDCVFRTFFPL